MHHRHVGCAAINATAARRPNERAGACLVGRGKHLRRPPALKISPLDSMRTSPGKFTDLLETKHSPAFKQVFEQDFKIRGVLDVIIVFR